MTRRAQESSVTNWAELPTVLNVAEAARITRVGTHQIYNLANTKSFPAIRFGKIIRIPRDSFKLWLEQNNFIGGNYNVES